MQPHLAASFELEMLDRVGDVERGAIDAEFRQGAIEQLARGSDERKPGEVFRIPGLLADNEYAGIFGTASEHRLRRRFPQRTTLAAGSRVAQRGEAVVHGFGRRAFGDGALAWLGGLA